MKEYFDFTLEPGRDLVKVNYKKKDPEISIVVPFYNDKDFIVQTVTCLLNQTYPYFEILIIDDGSTDLESLETLEKVNKLDERIKVFHKKNEGLAATRDYGAQKASSETKFLMFIDADDLIDCTFLECAYWTLSTNIDASWAYSDVVGFGAFTYKWNKRFNSKKLKKENFLVSNAVIRKDAFIDVRGFELREKAVNEDWNFWLKLISKNRYPVHMSYYGQWYRRKNEGELARALANRKRSLEIINNTVKSIRSEVKAIEYPKFDFHENIIKERFEDILVPDKVSNKNRILIMIAHMGSNYFNEFYLEVVRKLQKKGYEIIIVSSMPCVNSMRQSFEKYAIVYDLTGFLNISSWLAFINYLIESYSIELLLNFNSEFGRSIIPYLKSKYNRKAIFDLTFDDENRNCKDSLLYDEKIKDRCTLDIDKFKTVYRQNKVSFLEDVTIKDTIENIINKIDRAPESSESKTPDFCNESVLMISHFFKSQEIKYKHFCSKYKFDVYIKGEKRGFSVRVKDILWKIPFWRKLVSSRFWKENIKKK